MDLVESWRVESTQMFEREYLPSARSAKTILFLLFIDYSSKLGFD